MYKPLNVALNARECAEVGELGYLGVHDVVHMQPLVYGFPRLRLQPPQAEGYLAVFHVHPQHIHLDLVADLDYVVRLGDGAPGHFGYVNQPVGAAEVDESAETADAGDFAGADFAHIELLHKAGFLRVSPLLNGLALREYGAVATSVYL